MSGLASTSRSTIGREGHAIIDLGGQFYESGRQHGTWGGGRGVQAISAPSQAYLSIFNLVLHRDGL